MHTGTVTNDMLLFIIWHRNFLIIHFVLWLDSDNNFTHSFKHPSLAHTLLYFLSLELAYQIWWDTPQNIRIQTRNVEEANFVSLHIYLSMRVN